MKKRGTRRVNEGLASGKGVVAARRALYEHYARHGRHHLPWRRTDDPYYILVSEIMLQQTQVDRVVPYFTAFVERFPDVRTLAGAELREVLALWSGLGYNRRAKFLHDAAKRIVAYNGGVVPRTYEELRLLPGVGEYTAKAVRVFAFDEPEVLIETNVRTVVVHHFFPKARRVSEARIRKVAAQLAQGEPPARFHAALMDYGTHLKATVGNASQASASYKKQKPFKGSLREVRGAILRLLATPKTTAGIRRALPQSMHGRLTVALRGLVRDGLVRKDNRRFTV